MSRKFIRGTSVARSRSSLHYSKTCLTWSEKRYYKVPLQPLILVPKEETAFYINREEQTSSSLDKSEEKAISFILRFSFSQIQTYTSNITIISVVESCRLPQ